MKLSIFFLFPFLLFAQSIQIATGSYTGNGTTQAITSAGFAPEVVFVKSASTQDVKFRVDAMGTDSSASLDNEAVGTDMIETLTSNGFTVGGDASVNAGTVVFHWVAMAGLTVKTGAYRGNGVDDRNITDVGYQPDLVIVKSEDTGVDRFAQWAQIRLGVGNSSGFSGDGIAVNRIQSFLSNGFQIGTDPRVNADGVDYWYIAIQGEPNAIMDSSYTGNGTTQTLSYLVGAFNSQWLWVKRSTAQGGAHRGDSHGTNTSAFFDDFANPTTAITAEGAGSFTVGSSIATNANGGTYYYLGFRTWTPPTISSFTPESGLVGASVVITGTFFTAASAVTFGGVSASYNVDSATQITATVPVNAITGAIVVTTSFGAATSGTDFTVLSATATGKFKNRDTRNTKRTRISK